MIVSLKNDANPTAVIGELARRGLWVSRVEHTSGGGPIHFVIAPHSAAVAVDDLARIEGISAVTTTRSAHPLVDQQGPSVTVGDTRIEAGMGVGRGPGAELGAGRAEPRAWTGARAYREPPARSPAPWGPVWMCGPCSVESEAHAREIAAAVAEMGVAFLRGGAFKPRSSPYAFQGVGAEGLGWLRRAADAYGLKVVTEALGEADVPPVAEHADLIQIGSRNMHNYALLKAIGKAGKPVLLKRGLAATVEEWLLSGEYLRSSGAPGVVFCERGIRTFDDTTRNLVDLGAVALLSHVLRLPVIVDPSHGAGRRDLIAPLARAALAAGAAGLMIETHDDPARALSDGPQALRLAELGAIVRELRGGWGGGA
jgi:3-deoxy-7-phosphoheptulonate synthase